MEGVTLTRVETTPPHGDVIRADVRWRAAAASTAMRGAAATATPTAMRPAAAAPRTAVIVAHGFKGFKDWGFFPLLCDRLALDGHLVVSFNTSLNGVGASLLDFTDLEAFGRNTVSREVHDFHWMVDRTLEGAWSEGRRPDALGLVGHSRGGGNAVVVASEREEVSALATWAAVSSFWRWTAEQERDWDATGVTHMVNARTGQEMPLYRDVWDDLRANAERFDLVAAAGRVRAPWLVLHGAEDTTVTLDEALALAGAGPTAELLALEGAGHTFEAVHPLEGVPPALENAVAATLRHLREGCGGGRDRQS